MRTIALCGPFSDVCIDRVGFLIDDRDTEAVHSIERACARVPVCNYVRVRRLRCITIRRRPVRAMCSAVGRTRLVEIRPVWAGIPRPRPGAALRPDGHAQCTGTRRRRGICDSYAWRRSRYHEPVHGRILLRRVPAPSPGGRRVRATGGRGPGLPALRQDRGRVLRAAGGRVRGPLLLLRRRGLLLRLRTVRHRDVQQQLVVRPGIRRRSAGVTAAATRVRVRLDPGGRRAANSARAAAATAVNPSGTG